MSSRDEASSWSRRLRLLPTTLFVCRLEPGPAALDRLPQGSFSAVIRLSGEACLVGETGALPAGLERSGPWLALVLEGPLAHDLVGVLTSVLEPLAAAGVPVFALSTFDTDVVLVPEGRLADAQRALGGAGIQLRGARRNDSGPADSGPPRGGLG